MQVRKSGTFTAIRRAVLRSFAALSVLLIVAACNSGSEAVSTEAPAENPIAAPEVQATQIIERSTDRTDREPGGETATNGQAPGNEFTTCVADAIGSDKADLFEFDGGSVNFVGSGDPSAVNQAELAQIFECAGLAPDEEPVVSDPTPVPDQSVTPAIADQTPVPALPEYEDPDQIDFQRCVTNSVGAGFAEGVEIGDGELRFVGEQIPTDSDDLAKITECAVGLGLVEGSAVQAAPPDQVPGAGASSASELLFRECVSASARGDLAPGVKLTPGGLPDFTMTPDLSLSILDFQSIIDCVPGIGDELAIAPLSEASRSAAQAVVDSALQSVVFLETDAPAGGTGFFISTDGLIITNQHVVDGAGEIFVWLHDGTRLTASYLGGGSTPDIAVLKVNEAITSVPLKIGSTANLNSGDQLIAIGHPAGVGNWVSSIGEFLFIEQSSALMSGPTTTSDSTVVLDMEMSMPSSSGNSGGPILDSDGRVVGVLYNGTPRGTIRQDGSPVVSRDPASELLVLTSTTQAVPIELALQTAASLTGDSGLAPATSAVATEVIRTLDEGHRDCMTGAIGSQADLVSLLPEGLPDFSRFGDQSLTAPQFDALLRCLPGLHPIPSPVSIARAERVPQLDPAIAASLANIGEAARESVVSVATGGTGFIISADGLMLTNQHVIDGIEEPIFVWTFDGKKYPATLLGAVSQPDVALLKIDAPVPLVPLTLASTSRSLVAGDPVVIVGHPSGMGNWVMSTGEFGRTRDAYTLDAELIPELVFTAPSMSGNSGSPVISSDGLVVGIVWSGENPSDARRLLDANPPIPADPSIRQYMTFQMHAVAVAIEEAISRIALWN